MPKKSFSDDDEVNAGLDEPFKKVWEIRSRKFPEVLKNLSVPYSKARKLPKKRAWRTEPACQYTNHKISLDAYRMNLVQNMRLEVSGLSGAACMWERGISPEGPRINHDRQSRMLRK
jgi:hypothetical protein